MEWKNCLQCGRERQLHVKGQCCNCVYVKFGPDAVSDLMGTPRDPTGERQADWARKKSRGLI